MFRENVKIVKGVVFFGKKCDKYLSYFSSNLRTILVFWLFQMTLNKENDRCFKNRLQNMLYSESLVNKGEENTKDYVVNQRVTKI